MNLEEVPTAISRLETETSRLKSNLESPLADVIDLAVKMQTNWNIERQGHDGVLEENTKLTGEIAQMETTIASLESDKSSQQTVVANAEADLASKKAEVGQVQAKVSELDTQKAELLRANVMKDAKVESLTSNAAELDQNIESEKQRHAQNTEDIRRKAISLKEHNDMTEGRFRALHYLCFVKKLVTLHELKIIDMIRDGANKKQIYMTAGVGAAVIDRTIEALEVRNAIEVAPDGSIKMLQAL